MSNCELIPLCASPEDLYDFYISNHKNLTKQDLELEYEQHGISFFRKLIEHFVGYHYTGINCVVIREGLPLIRRYRKGEINHIFYEYMIDLDKICDKRKKDFKVLVLPFKEEGDIIPFVDQLSSAMNVRINLWRGKEMSYDEVES